MNSRKPKLIKITKKNEYLRMRSGLKISTPGFILQARQREMKTQLIDPQLGMVLLAQKELEMLKRNRAKRRLRL